MKKIIYSIIIVMALALLQKGCRLFKVAGGLHASEKSQYELVQDEEKNYFYNQCSGIRDSVTYKSCITIKNCMMKYFTPDHFYTYKYGNVYSQMAMEQFLKQIVITCMNMHPVEANNISLYFR